MINMKSKVSGRYRFTRVAAANGEVREQTPWMDNLITDNGLDLMAGGNYLDECAVGTGSTAPAFTDTALASFVASTATSSDTRGRQITTSPFYIFKIISFAFAEGAAEGNLAEVGVGDSSTSLFSRALIKDGSGNPTTITVLADEFLNVEYELRVEIPETDTTGTFDIDSTTYTWTGRASEIDTTWDLFSLPWDIGAVESLVYAYDGDIGAITASPTGSSDSPTSITVSAYNSGDNKSTADLVWEPTDGNFASGIGAVAFGADGASGTPYRYQIGFSPKIPKTNTDKFTITVSHSWGRK